MTRLDLKKTAILGNLTLDGDVSFDAARSVVTLAGIGREHEFPCSLSGNAVRITTKSKDLSEAMAGSLFFGDVLREGAVLGVRPSNKKSIYGAEFVELPHFSAHLVAAGATVRHSGDVLTIPALVADPAPLEKSARRADPVPLTLTAEVIGNRTETIRELRACFDMIKAINGTGLGDAEAKRLRRVFAATRLNSVFGNDTLNAAVTAMSGGCPERVYPVRKDRERKAAL